MDVVRNGVYLVMDFEGYGWKNWDMKFQRRLMEVYQVHSLYLSTEPFPPHDFAFSNRSVG